MQIYCSDDRPGPTLWVPTVGGSPHPSLSCRISQAELGGRNVSCAGCAPVLCWAAVAICTGLCCLWLSVFASKNHLIFWLQLPTLVWLPLGFSSRPASCHITAVSAIILCGSSALPGYPGYLGPFIHLTTVQWAPTLCQTLFKTLELERPMRCRSSRRSLHPARVGRGRRFGGGWGWEEWRLAGDVLCRFLAVGVGLYYLFPPF